MLSAAVMSVSVMFVKMPVTSEDWRSSFMATCWEIAIKVGLKKLDLGEPATTFLPRELAANNFAVLGIELAHVTFVETLPPHHKDPFDRILISQSLLETMPIVSADTLFDPYGVTRLWK